MAHVEHYKMSDVRRLTNEWTRDEAYHCTDGHIDPARTPNNYVIDDSYKYGMKLKRSCTFSAAVRARLQEVQHSNRKDLNVLSDWVITCPQELLGDDTKIKRFFEVAYEFTADRYGKENVLQGFVHMDETTPHMHMPLMPVKDGRVSSKALFTRTELSSYHKALEKVMEDEFGMHGLVLNGRTKGNYTVKEMKQRTRDEEENARLRAQNAAEQARLAEAVQRRMAAEKAAEAALTARDEALTARDEALAVRDKARKEVFWLRNVDGYACH